MDYFYLTGGAALAWAYVGIFGAVFSIARAVRYFRRNRDARANLQLRADEQRAADNLAQSLARTDRTDSGPQSYLDRYRAADRIAPSSDPGQRAILRSDFRPGAYRPLPGGEPRSSNAATVVDAA